MNAITKAIPIMQALQDLDARLNQQTHPAFADLEHPINLNIGVINGGDWPSTVPGACELHCRLSCYPVRLSRRPGARSSLRLPGRSLATPGSRSTHAAGLGRFPERGSTVSMDEPSVQLLSYWHEQVFGAPMGSRPEPASTTCATTTSSGSPPGAMARPGATGMPPMNGSICTH